MPLPELLPPPPNIAAPCASAHIGRQTAIVTTPIALMGPPLSTGLSRSSQRCDRTSTSPGSLGAKYRSTAEGWRPCPQSVFGDVPIQFSGWSLAMSVGYPENGYRIGTCHSANYQWAWNAEHAGGLAMTVTRTSLRSNRDSVGADSRFP